VVFKFFSICTRLSARALMSLMLVAAVEVDCAGPTWPALYQSYVRAFLDNQIRVIDRDTGDRTTSEAQAYAMFFALVANDRSRFDGLLRWTELNLAAGDLTAQLPAWLWGRDSSDRWGVLDTNAAADADVWMAYVLLEAGRAWNDQRYTAIGRSLAKRIAAEEVADIGGIGPVLMPAPKGFRQDDAIRLNASYLPLQVFVGLGHLLPDGPWERIAQRISTLVSASAPHGFATDWVDFAPGRGFSASDAGSYDAIRVYLWAGMLDAAAPGRDAILRSLSGMADWVRKNAAPPEKVRRDGSVDVPNGPVGFSAALLPYLSAIGEKKLADAQSGRLRSALDSRTGLYGRPSKYYDQNLALFALGWTERRFWFDSNGTLKTWWKN